MGEVTYRYLYKIYQQNAKRKENAFELDLEKFKELIMQPCAYCGIEGSLTTSRYINKDGKLTKEGIDINIDIEYARSIAVTHNGIDRIDNNKGYVKDNCNPCCHWCNRAKRDKSYVDFKEWVDAIRSSLEDTEG